MIKSIFLALLAWLAGYRIRTSVVTSQIQDEYDFIIVGAGTTGAAIAGRLSEDPNVKILVLEAGMSDLSVPSLRVPVDEPLIKTSADWNYRTIPQKYASQALSGQIERWPRGKILGGTSSMNHMIYNRGSPHDFDSWEDHGAVGWSWKDIRPFFTKLERADKTLSKKFGRFGPVPLSQNYKRPILNDIVEKAAKELGFTRTEDIDEMVGFTEIVVTRDDGLRVNSIEAYLRDHFPERKERLHIVIGAYVTQILFDRGGNNKRFPRASGVKFVKNGLERMVTAKKEVILSAGVVETPHLLMLSGIGPKEHLENHGIPIVADLPGVGSNLQDHIRMLYLLYSDKMPVGAGLTGEETRSSVPEYLANGTGPHLHNLLSSFINLRTKLGGKPISASTDKRPFPEIQLSVFSQQTDIKYFTSSDEVETYNISDFVSEINDAILLRNGIISSFGMVAGMLHPKSTGTIRLNSSDPFQYPLINPMYFSNKDDVDVFVAGLKVVDDLLNTDTFRSLGVRQVMQPYCKDLENASPRSDEFYRCWLSQTAATQYHPCCTAKIGRKSDVNAVVDERLRVHGVDGLRVADASVMPHHMSGNPQAVCYMIAEKASYMIKEDWSMKLTRI